MGVFVARRLLLAAVAVVGLTVITFVISHAAPADPIVANLGQQASQRPEIVAAFRAKWGLDRPLHQQYLTFLRGVATGDFGISINTRRPVARDLRQFLPATIELSIMAIVFAIAAGLPLGVLSALYRDGPIDHLARLVSLVGV
ncbi:MAG TPA: ABC transporter permease, partial [bacterium]